MIFLFIAMIFSMQASTRAIRFQKGLATSKDTNFLCLPGQQSRNQSGSFSTKRKWVRLKYIIKLYNETRESNLYSLASASNPFLLDGRDENSQIDPDLGWSVHGFGWVRRRFRACQDPRPSTATPKCRFHFQCHPPHANPLPYDAQDVAHATVTPQGYRDGAGVFVYGTCGNKRWVLLDDLIDCGHARPRSRKYRFTGVSGAQESLELFGGFTQVLYDPSFINVMKALP